MKKNVKNTVKNNEIASHLLFNPERTVMSPEATVRKVQKCSDWNDRGEERNFRQMVFNNITFKNENLSGLECHYSIFNHCTFEGTILNRMEAHFAQFNNCEWKNCSLENSTFAMASINDCNFYNSNLNDTDFSFATGCFAATSSLMERCTANNSILMLVLSNTDVSGFEANCANISLDVKGSSFRRAEFNDSTVSGQCVQTDLTGAELNRSDLAELELVDCATHNMEKEDSFCIGFDKVIEDALNELEEGPLDN